VTVRLGILPRTLGRDLGGDSLVSLLLVGGGGLSLVAAAGHPNLDGNDAKNIVNRALLGMGGHLELTGARRDAMFTDNSRPRRKDTTTKVFWNFPAACPNALARLEATQVIL
jgi:phage replication-related protein YjqB (UPF0714/DUF867 family)